MKTFSVKKRKKSSDVEQRKSLTFSSGYRTKRSMVKIRRRRRRAEPIEQIFRLTSVSLSGAERFPGIELDVLLFPSVLPSLSPPGFPPVLLGLDSAIVAPERICSSIKRKRKRKAKAKPFFAVLSSFFGALAVSFPSVYEE